MKKFFIVFFSFLLLIGTVCITACTSSTKAEKVLLCTVTYSDSVNYKSVSIKATVLPASAVNKEVDFSLNWAENSPKSDEDISQYVVVEPDSDGSCNAVVKCFKGFPYNEIILTVKTRDGGFTDTCIITYSGTANSFTIINNYEGHYYDSLKSSDYLLKHNLVLSDGFTDEIIGNYLIERGGVGSLYFATISKTDELASENGEIIIPGSWDASMSLGSLDSYTNVFFESVYIKDGILTVKFNSTFLFDGKTYGSYDETSSTITDDVGVILGYTKTYTYRSVYCLSGTENDYANFVFASEGKYNAENISNCYFYLTITDSISGLSQTINFPLVV